VLNRRHIRIKVLQTIYAMQQSGQTELDKLEKFMYYNMEQIEDLYLMMITLLIEVRRKEESHLVKLSQKHLASPEERNPNRKFVDLEFLRQLSRNSSISEAVARKKFDLWEQNDDYVILIWQEIRKSDVYNNFMNQSTSTEQSNRDFVEQIFAKIIAPNDKLYDYIEDLRLSWIDDLPVVNTLIIKQIRQSQNFETDIKVPKVFKDLEDREFGRNLFRKTVLNNTKLQKEYENKTPNWDAERIASVDTIMLEMAICEFLYFPSIPVKVTINEYLEIAKEYSTPKSSIFINGILENLVKDYQQTNKLQKSGRGLM
jgi:transcription antitermination protein NusB